MPIYPPPPTSPPAGKAEAFFHRKIMPSCPTKRDVTGWYMWTTLSGINASNYFAYTGTSPESVAARQEKIDESIAHMINLYHNFRFVRLFVDFSSGGDDAWYYAGEGEELIGGGRIPFSGIITNEDVYGEGSTDPLTEDDLVEFLEDTAGGFLQDSLGYYEDPETGNPYFIDVWTYRYPKRGTLFDFSDERPPNTRVPCQAGNLSINGAFYEPLVNYFPFFEALYYDGTYMGVAVREISSWGSGWLMTDCGRFTGTQGTVILGGSIQSDSTTGTSSNMDRDLAYVDFPDTIFSWQAPKMICEATALGYQSRSANAAGLTASGTTVTGNGATYEATNTIYPNLYVPQGVWFWQYE